MRRRSALPLVLAALLVVSTPPAALLANADTGPPPAPETHLASVDSDAIGGNRHDLTMKIALQPDGDARWTVTTYVDIEGENGTGAFRDMRITWEDGDLDVGPDIELFRRFARLASDATNRSMRIPDASVERSAELVDGGERGAFRLSFTWTNFARRTGDRLVINRTFRTESGTWLSGLEAGQRLVIKPPSGFSIQQTPEGAGIINQSLVWTGPVTFPPGYFTERPIVFKADGDQVTPTPTPTPTARPPTATTTTPGPDSGGSLGLWMGVGAAILLGGGLALYRVLGTDRFPGGTPGGTAEPAAGDGGEAAGEPAAEAATGAADEAGAETATDEPEPEPESEPEPTPEAPFAGVDEELLSDEERVLRLLEANGGRMKQADIVKETGWSNAKVSQLLSSMAEDDEVDKLRIGRENLISKPDVDVGEVE